MELDYSITYYYPTDLQLKQHVVRSIIIVAAMRLVVAKLLFNLPRTRRLNVFLDREVVGEFVVEVECRHIVVGFGSRFF